MQPSLVRQEKSLPAATTVAYCRRVVWTGFARRATGLLVERFIEFLPRSGAAVRAHCRVRRSRVDLRT